MQLGSLQEIVAQHVHDGQSATVPAINPDVTVLHAQAADREGNILIQGIVGAQKKRRWRRLRSSSLSRRLLSRWRRR